MGGQDFREWQQEYMRIWDAGYDPEDLDAVVGELCVLPFRRNVEKGEGVISEHNGTIVFVDPRFHGLRPGAGEVWFCSVWRRDRVYNATPLMEVTPEVMSRLSKEVRDGMVDMLWESHRDDLMGRFEDKYMAEVRDKALEDARMRYEPKISELERKVEDLETQLAHSLMLIRGGADDGIELTSEEPETGEVSIDPSPEPPVVSPVAPAVTLGSMFRRSQFVPGMPEMHRPESRGDPTVHRVRVERVAEGTLSCDELPDGKYFVHTSYNGRYLVIRPNDHGKAVCRDHVLDLQDLGRFSRFTGRVVLEGEYNDRLDGLLVHMLPGDDGRYPI